MIELPGNIDRDAQLLDLDRVDCEESLHTFLQHAWKYMDPAPFTDGWHLQAIAEHLEAIVDGQIRRLIINLPPRHCKSLLLSVAFPAWVWSQTVRGPVSGPNVPFLFASYADKLSLRDSVKCRRLIESTWYQKRWSNRFSLTSDQNTKSRFANDQGGERLITSIGAGVTGEGGNCFVAGTTVSTPSGDFLIENLKPGDSVYSFDVQQGKVVISIVLACSIRKSNALCEVREVSGHRLVCTKDHQIYSPGRGFVRADKMGAGSALLVIGEDGKISAKNHAVLEVRQLLTSNGQASIRSAQSAETRKSRCILQQEVLFRSSRFQKLHGYLQKLRKICCESTRSILLRRLQDIRQEVACKKTRVSHLWNGIHRAAKVLLWKMCRQRPLQAYDGFSEFEIQSPRYGGLFESVQSHENYHQAAGRVLLHGMRISSEDGSTDVSSENFFTCSSHRREPEKQQPGKSYYSLREVPQPASHWNVENICEVARDSSQEVSVYDIQVEGTSCFFAEGILVHNCIIVDDPNAANDVSSEATMATTIDWWTTAMPTRANDPATCAWIIIQQRLAEDDLTGHILEHEADGWTHLCLPGRYEPERSFHTSIGWKDPRTEPGELLWPQRFSDESLNRLEVTMGPYIFAGQIQQRPEPKGGGIIKREWWKVWESDSYPPMDFIIGVLDGAYTEDRMNDPSGMIVWGIFSGDVRAQTTRIVGPGGEIMRPDSTYSEFAPQVMCMYAWDERLELHDLVQKTATTCIKMKVDLLVIENKASGISVAQEIRRLYSRERFGVKLFDPKSQDKAARLYSVQHLFAEGIVHGPERPWMDRVITQVGQFPKGKHDEYVDLTSMGLRELRDMGLLIRQPEREAELEAAKVYRPGQAEPLYPA